MLPTTERQPRPGIRGRLHRLLPLVGLLAGCMAMGPPSAPPAPPASVVARVRIGSAPTLLATAPDGQRLYAASNGSISIIDTATNTVLKTIKHGSNSTGIDVAPNGAKAYVTTLRSSDLIVIDTNDEALADGISLSMQRTPGGYGSLAVSPDNETVYVANRANQSFGIVDLENRRSRVLNPTVWPLDVAVSADGRTVYSAGCTQICTPGYLQMFDVPSGRFTQRIQVDGSPYRIVLSPDGATAFVANLTGPSVSFVDLGTHSVTATVAVPPQPTGLGVSPDGSTLYVASQTAGALSVIDVSSAAVREQLAVDQARDIAVSADGHRLYVSSGDQVLVIDTARLSP